MDDGERGELLSIGEFARRCRLPVTTLRWYHGHGLFLPAWVDPATGYRYYRPDQLEMAATVAALRRIGVRPELIGAIARGEADLAAVLASERARLAQELAERTASLVSLDALLAAAEAPALPSIEEPPVLRWGVASAVPLPCLAGTVRAGQATGDLRRLLARLRRQLRDAGVAVSSARFGARFPLDLDTDPIAVVVFSEGLGEWEARWSGPVLVLPAAHRRVATLTHYGPSDVGLAYHRLLAWIAAQAYQPADVVLERYGGDHSSPCIELAVEVAC